MFLQELSAQMPFESFFFLNCKLICSDVIKCVLKVPFFKNKGLSAMCSVKNRQEFELLLICPSGRRNHHQWSTA